MLFRSESVALVRRLRKQEPHIASLIGFYNAGLSRSERARVETLFREGGLQILVATSAFGEGVDIPMSKIEDYHSHNTTRLDVEGMKKLLLRLRFIQEDLGLIERAKPREIRSE